jgi:ABC-type siderophore export system fused ATPase/permease subunit
LHWNGAAIFVITRGPHYANFAARTIHFFDGQIAEDADESVKQAGYSPPDFRSPAPAK